MAEIIGRFTRKEDQEYVGHYYDCGLKLRFDRSELRESLYVRMIGRIAPCPKCQRNVAVQACDPEERLV